MYSNNSKTNSQWGVEQCVTSLRQLRLESLESRKRLEHPPRLPSRKILAGIVDQLGAALFPHRLGKHDISPEAVDYFVGHTLSGALNDLYQQIRLELIFQAEQQGVVETDIDIDIQAETITHQFTTRLPEIRTLLDTDLQAAYEGDPSAHNIDEVLVCYPGLTAVVHHDWLMFYMSWVYLWWLGLFPRLPIRQPESISIQVRLSGAAFLSIMAPAS